MKLPVVFFSAFAVLTLCLPLAAVGSLPPILPAETKQAAQTVSSHAVRPDTAAPDRQSAAEAAGLNPETAAPAAASGDPFNAADSFRILNLATGKVETVSRADYVRGAVCAEMPPDFHTEALTAQAVAANTYAVRCRLNQQKSPDPALKGADFSANPGNWEGYVTEEQARERFGDQFDVYWNKLSKAADQGAGYVMVYGDEPIVAAYHSISTGRTEYAGNVWEGGAPYLVPVDSFGDTLAPNYQTTAGFSAQEVADRLRTAYPDVALGEDRSGWLRVVSRSESGYALEVMTGNQTTTGKDIRRIFDLRSADFDVVASGDTFTFTVRGYGHGVGLSQYGADYMARQGANFQEILEHYYAGGELRPVR